MAARAINETPLRHFTQHSGGRINKHMIEGLLFILNGKFFKGLGMLLFENE